MFYIKNAKRNYSVVKKEKAKDSKKIKGYNINNNLYSCGALYWIDDIRGT